MTGGRETNQGSPELSGPVVVDASVVVEFLVELRGPAAAWRLFESLSEGDLERVAPDLLYLEVTSALRKLLGRGELEARAASRAVAMLGQLPIRGLATQPLLVDLWAWCDSLTPYDAACAALAKSTGLPLVTADAGLATAARRRSIRAVTLEDLTVRADQPAAGVPASPASGGPDHAARASCVAALRPRQSTSRPGPQSNRPRASSLWC